MPFEPHTRVRCNGIFTTPAGPAEIFSYGFAIVGADFLTQAQAATLSEPCVLFHGDTRTHITGSALLNEVAVSRVGANGRQVGETLRVPVNNTGGGGVIKHPTQVALRVSLGSGLRGRSQRGGFYIPGVTSAVEADTLLANPGQVDQVVESVLVLIQGLKNALPGPGGTTGAGKMVVASSVAGNVPVNKVRVGLAFDTVRTRRNALSEAYRLADVPA